MKTQQKVTFCLSGVGAILGGCAVFFLCGFRLVLSPSVPMGVYRTTQDPITRGTYVAVCLPRAVALFGRARGYLLFGFCEGWVQPAIKHVGALAGDSVEVEVDGVTINGDVLAHSELVPTDSVGRVLPHMPCGRYQVAEGEVWLLSMHDKRSWDSRYFGAVPLSQVISTARPVWVRE